MVIKVEPTLETVFDSYTLGKQIGQGGNGRVFKAKNDNNEQFAIKIVESSKLNSTKRKRFKNEVYFCMQSDNKNIIKIIDYGTGVYNNKDIIFYVMPLCDCTLREKMKSQLTPEDIIEIFCGTLNGLKYAHKQGAIHRDIKPENILFMKNSKEPIIADFGIAHFEEDNLITAVETKAADKLANFQYAAPEQRKKGGIANATTDLYSLALILNEMFTGEIPQAADYKTIASINPDYDFLDDLFSLLFKQKQSERLQSADEVLKELKARLAIKAKQKQIFDLQNYTTKKEKTEKRETHIIDAEYDGQGVILTLDQPVDRKWFSELKAGNYTHTYSLGYDCNTLQLFSNDQIYMPLKYATDKNFIKSIVSGIKSWIKSADECYNKSVEEEQKRKAREEEQQRVEKIKLLERENDINKALKEMF